MNPPIAVLNGQMFWAHASPSGKVAGFDNPCRDQTELHIRNDLQQETINANIYLDGSLLVSVDLGKRQ